jgi:Na+-driven multidrug efflux pump
MDARTRRILEGAILPLLLRLAWPNILVMVAHSATGLIELWFVARLGSDALTAMALVLPVLILMQNMSQGAMGGGIASAIARARGAGQRDKADQFASPCARHQRRLRPLPRISQMPRLSADPLR